MDRDWIAKHFQRAIDDELKKLFLWGANTASTATDKQTSVSAGSLTELWKALSEPMVPQIPRLKMISSTNAVERDGTRPLTVKRSLKERFFSRPWQPWVPVKIIQVPNWKPCIYKVGDMVIYHPSLEAKIKAWVADQ